MRRFRFRLEGLRRLRTVRERQARRELADLLRALRNAEEGLQQALVRVRKAEARVREANAAGALRMAAEALERSRAEALAAERSVAALKARVETAWARFLQARTDRRVVDRLRERRLQ